MSHFNLSLIYITGSVLTFSVASLGYTFFSRARSPLWMAIVKNWLALFFTVAVLLFQSLSFQVFVMSYWPFLLSGFLGLGMADLFLLGAFQRIGPGRVLILFAFQPVFTGFFSFWLFGQEVLRGHLSAILFFILCLYFFSQESKEENTEEEGDSNESIRASTDQKRKGLFLALSAVICDATGVMLTKHGFDLNPGISAFQVNYIRLVAALAFLLPMGWRWSPKILQGFKGFNIKEKGALLFVSFSGSFLSLIFYMEAIRYGTLAIITSAVLVDPLVATVLECWWFRRRVSPWLVKALVAFLCAVLCLVLPQLWGL